MKNRKVLNNPNEKGGLKNSKSNNINNNMNNTNNNIHIQQISYSNNNLNFNFENKEQIIKDLERQIEYERKLRLVIYNKIITYSLFILLINRIPT